MTVNVTFCMPPSLTPVIEKYLVGDEIKFLMQLFASEATQAPTIVSLPFPEHGQLLSNSAFFFTAQVKRISTDTIWVEIRAAAYLNPSIGEWEQLH